MTIDQVFLTVFLASLLGFGGLGSLPVLRGGLTDHGIAADPLILQSLAVGNISPGPNGLYLIAIGYFLAGIAGAGAASVAILLPPLLVLVLERVRERLIGKQRFRACLQSLSLAVVALLTVSSSQLVLHAARGPVTIGLVILGAVLLTLRVPSLVGVIAAAAAGLLLGL
jgi:chromate transporter